jgi:Na+-transporting methylmalonyl-CoA/oxaloacetate decarboxylase gamma subunit
MLVTGLELMIIGMAVVFFFLMLLVVVLKVVGVVLQTLQNVLPEKAELATERGENLREVAIALAAVSDYMKSQAR